MGLNLCKTTRSSVINRLSSILVLVNLLLCSGCVQRDVNEEAIVFAYGVEVNFFTSLLMLSFLGFAMFMSPVQEENVTSQQARKMYIVMLAIPMGCFWSLLHTMSTIELNQQQVVFHQPWGKYEYLLDEIEALNMRWENNGKNGLVENYYMTLADGAEVSLNFNKQLMHEAWPDLKYKASTKGVVISDPPRPVVQCRCRKVE